MGKLYAVVQCITLVSHEYLFLCFCSDDSFSALRGYMTFGRWVTHESPGKTLFLEYALLTLYYTVHACNLDRMMKNDSNALFTLHGSYM